MWGLGGLLQEIRAIPSNHTYFLNCLCVNFVRESTDESIWDLEVLNPRFTQHSVTWRQRDASKAATGILAVLSEKRVEFYHQQHAHLWQDGPALDEVIFDRLHYGERCNISMEVMTHQVEARWPYWLYPWLFTFP